MAHNLYVSLVSILMFSKFFALIALFALTSLSVSQKTDREVHKQTEQLFRNARSVNLAQEV